MTYSQETRQKGIECARDIADFLVHLQNPIMELSGEAGRVNFFIDNFGRHLQGCQWNAAFAIMGWLSAYKVFKDEKYLHSCNGAARYLKSLQIFNPYLKKHYGAIREWTSQTTWCFPRDGLSAAWSFIEMFRYTQDEEYLDRAKLFGEWFLSQAIDEQGWPYWGVQFEPFFENDNGPRICNDMQGCFHGGSLNYFYQMFKATGDDMWVGEPYVKMADFLVTYIQQENGFFRTIVRETHKLPEEDPQNGLHRANDDFCTLGLLGAYKLTGEKKYLSGIEKFLAAAFEKQQPDGMFDTAASAIPVILNILHEAGNFVDVPLVNQQAKEKALSGLFNAQEKSFKNPKSSGGIIEPNGSDNFVSARASCYSLIYLLKEFAGAAEYLSV